MAYGVYTYDAENAERHVYGPIVSKPDADALVAKLRAENWKEPRSNRVASVLPAELLSTDFASPDCKPMFALVTMQFCFNCPSIPHLYISPDPAALDALGRALESSPAAMSYVVRPLRAPSV